MDTAERVTKGKDLDEERRERVLAGISPENYDAACEAKRLFENFVDLVEDDRPAGGEAPSAADD
jgi:GMP synthase (glutamine-hydrolysing)